MNSAECSQPFGKLAILLCTATAEQPESCVMPLVYAATAAAMDVEVEVHFTGGTVRLLVEGVAAGITPTGSEQTSLYDHMRTAASHGVRFIGCSMALGQYVAAHETKIAEFAGAAGAATVVMRSLDPHWRVLAF